MRATIFLIVLLGSFLSCESDGIKKISPMADDLGDISIEDVLSDEDFLVEYEDIYLDSSTVVQRKKDWQDYRTFVTRLKKTPIQTSDLVKGDSINANNLLESILGKKRWTLLTPALWEDASSAVSIGDSPKGAMSISSQIGDRFIEITQGGNESPNGKASLGQFFLDLGQQDIYVDILLTPKSGYITEFEQKTDQVFAPWTDSPIAKSAVTDIISDKEKLKEHSLYLVLAFPLHQTKPYGELVGADLDSVKKLQEGIRKYIWDGAQFQFPFGSSIQTFLSTRISRNSINNSQGSYMGRSMYALGMQILLTQYQYISVSTFSQMLGKVFDGGFSSEKEKMPPGYRTQSIAYRGEDKNNIHATTNTVLMVPFLIDKVLEDSASKKKGLLLKGNPLAIRMISIQPTEELSSFGNTSVKSSLKENSFTNAISGSISFQNKDATKLKKEIKILGDSAQTIGMNSNILQKVLDVLGNFEKDKPLKEIVSDEVGPNLFREMSNEGLAFSWESLKKVFEEDESRKTILRAQSHRSKNGLGITEHKNIKDHNVGALLKYVGFNLIFWPEEDLGYVRNKLQQDYQK